MSRCVDGNKLRQRRKEVELTLEYLRAETRQVERNEKSMEPAAFQRRIYLFKRMIDWYEREHQEIDGRLAGLPEALIPETCLG
jgi:hypothetical protein